MNASPLTEPVFTARGLTKTYRMGEVEVQALRGIDLELYRGEQQRVAICCCATSQPEHWTRPPG
jgi:ABC-type lipoprotein export system ATPase subunit